MGTYEKRPPQTHLLAQMRGSRPLKITMVLYQIPTQNAIFPMKRWKPSAAKCSVWQILDI